MDKWDILNTKTRQGWEFIPTWITTTKNDDDCINYVTGGKMNENLAVVIFHGNIYGNSSKTNNVERILITMFWISSINIYNRQGGRNNE